MYIYIWNDTNTVFCKFYFPPFMRIFKVDKYFTNYHLT